MPLCKYVIDFGDASLRLIVGPIITKIMKYSLLFLGKTDSIQYSFKTETGIQNKYSLFKNLHRIFIQNKYSFFKSLEYLFKKRCFLNPEYS